MKIILRIFKKLIPTKVLHRIQYLHYKLARRFLVHHRGEVLGLSHKPAMVFSPHQDDETFGCGGMISLKREYGIPVSVVFLTDGHGCGGNKPLSKEQIIKMREEEAVQALTILDVDPSKIHFLKNPDGNLQNLDYKERNKTIAKIVELLKAEQPQEVYVPHCKDFHKDHQATYELVQEAIFQAGVTVEVLQYPIWIFWESPLFIKLRLSDIATAYRLSISSVRHKKARAIAAYSSQLEALPHGFAKLFFTSEEIFFKVKT